MHKNTTYATPASLLAPRSGHKATAAVASTVFPSGTSHYIQGGTQGGLRRKQVLDLPSLTVKEWLAHADKYERPSRERIIAAAVGRAQARYANEGIFPVEWNGKNARLLVATPDTVEVALADTRIRTTTENEARFMYLPLARQEVLRYSLDYCLAYESERRRVEKGGGARGASMHAQTSRRRV